MKNQRLKGMLIVIILLFLPSPAFSQGGITFSPLSVDLELAPGSRSNFSFNVINETEREVYFSCFIADVLQGERGEYLPVTESKESLAPGPQVSCSNWIKLSEQKIVVPPLQRKEIKAELTVPGSASPGSYVAMVVFQSENQETDRRSVVEGAMPAATDISLQAGGVVFLQVQRRGVRQTRTGRYGEIEKFEVVKEKEGLKFIATLSNRGKNFIEGKGQLVISKEGKKIIDSPLGSGRGRVIPGNKINFVTLLTRPLPPGEYSALALIDYGGISTAQARVSFNVKEGETVESTTFEKKLSAIEEPISITLKNDLIESKILSHSNRNFTVPVYNDSSRSLIIETSVRDVSSIESTRFSPYVKVTPTEFEIPPHKSKAVKITINNPDELTDGNKYVRVDFVPKKANAEPLSEELQKTFSTSAFLMLDNIKGEKKEEVSIKNMEVNLIEERQGEFRPQIVINYLNTGNVHINPSCSITLSEVIDEKVREKGAVAVMPETISFTSGSDTLDVVLPGMESSLVLDSRTPIKPGKFQAEITIKNEGKEILKETKTFEIK